MMVSIKVKNIAIMLILSSLGYAQNLENLSNKEINLIHRKYGVDKGFINQLRVGITEEGDTLPALSNLRAFKVIVYDNNFKRHTLSGVSLTYDELSRYNIGIYGYCLYNWKNLCPLNIIDYNSTTNKLDNKIYIFSKTSLEEILLFSKEYFDIEHYNKMVPIILKWNEEFGIEIFRVSSNYIEMFIKYPEKVNIDKLAEEWNLISPLVVKDGFNDIETLKQSLREDRSGIILRWRE
jgi:hypothetical protein